MFIPEKEESDSDRRGDKWKGHKIMGDPHKPAPLPSSLVHFRK